MGKTKKSAPMKHLQWLVDTNRLLRTSDGKRVRIMELRHVLDDEILSAWATHFRNHYCSDGQIDRLRRGTGLSRAKYLRKIKFPDQKIPPGPSIRAGDFGEILVADYLRFVLGYWLPRTRYDKKVVRNESTKGTDIIGFKVLKRGVDDPKDSLAIFETKAQFSGKKPKARLQNAVDDSSKDEIRKAESLNAIKQRLLDSERHEQVQVVERFQNPEDRPYTEQYGAVALFSSDVYDKAKIKSTDASEHLYPNRLILIVIHGAKMMELVHELYRRAADEA